MNRPVLLCHGGAGVRKPTRAALSGLEKVLRKSFKLLDEGSSALDAVTDAVKRMEDSGLYNAGKGANLQLDGVRRLDASIMEGASLEAGAVIGLEGFSNPVLLARCAMGMANKVLTNLGGEKIAEAEGLERLGPPAAAALKRLASAMEKGGPALELYRKYFSTVGAVALDSRAPCPRPPRQAASSRCCPGGSATHPSSAPEYTPTTRLGRPPAQAGARTY